MHWILEGIQFDRTYTNHIYNKVFFSSFQQMKIYSLCIHCKPHGHLMRTKKTILNIGPKNAFNDDVFCRWNFTSNRFCILNSLDSLYSYVRSYNSPLWLSRDHSVHVTSVSHHSCPGVPPKLYPWLFSYSPCLSWASLLMIHAS